MRYPLTVMYIKVGELVLENNFDFLKENVFCWVKTLLIDASIYKLNLISMDRVNPRYL